MSGADGCAAASTAFVPTPPTSLELDARRPARGCPSVWLPLTAKQRSAFVADMRGWLPGWGASRDDWQWLEALLDRPRWRDDDIVRLRAYCERGMGHAMNRLVGTSRDAGEWHRVRHTCHTEAPLMSMQQTQQSVLGTAAASLKQHMEAMRRGEWLDDTLLHREADALYEAARKDYIDDNDP